MVIIGKEIQTVPNLSEIGFAAKIENLSLHGI